MSRENNSPMITALLLCFLMLCIAFAAGAEEVPGVLAKSYIVTDLQGTVILEHDSKTPRPIASITKLLVAEQIYPTLDADDNVTIEKEDLATRRTKLRSRTTLTEQQLLELALVHSSNQAIYALARTHDTDKIVAAVNAAALERGLTTITIEEPSGLSENNQASAE